MHAQRQEDTEGQLREEIIGILTRAGAELDVHEIHARSDLADDLPTIARIVGRMREAGEITRRADGDQRSIYRLREPSEWPNLHTETPPPRPARALDAAAVLREAAQAIEDRAALRDFPGGERSMARAVAVFNALTGAALTEVDGWQFMVCLKLARSRAGRFVSDDYTDNAAYAALAAEAAEREAQT